MLIEYYLILEFKSRTRRGVDFYSHRSFHKNYEKKKSHMRKENICTLTQTKIHSGWIALKLVLLKQLQLVFNICHWPLIFTAFTKSWVLWKHLYIHQQDLWRILCASLISFHFKHLIFRNFIFIIIFFTCTNVCKWRRLYFEG